MFTQHHSLRLNTPLRLVRASRGGFTLVEILVVVAVLAFMIALVGSSTGVIGKTQGMTAVTEITALCDLARGRAMNGEGPVMVAFAADVELATGEAYRSAILCKEDTSTEAADDYVAMSEWFYLPAGYVFSDIAAATPTAGGNVLTTPNSTRKVKVPGSDETVELPCLGFGALGEVVFPEADATAQDTLLIAIAEGDASSNGPVSRRGGPHRPGECRWVAVRRNSGTPMILP